MARGAGSQVQRRMIGTAPDATALAGLAAAWSLVYVRMPGPPMAVLSRTGEVDTASRGAKAETERRLEKIIDVLPGAPRQLGAAIEDHCLRCAPSRGDPLAR